MQNKTIHSSNVSPHRYPPLFAAVFERVWSYFHNMVKGVVIFWEALQNKTFQGSGVSWRHFLHKKFVESITRLFACSDVQHILCCAFCLVYLLLMCPMWSVSLNYSILDCSFGFLYRFFENAVFDVKGDRSVKKNCTKFWISDSDMKCILRYISISGGKI